MKQSLDIDTIAAVATAPGRGGIGIVRLSGPSARYIAETISTKQLTPRLAIFSTFKDSNSNIIDSGIALFFPSPASFTGEDVVELQGHGGPIVLHNVLKRCLSLGARQARPGEFSERAFLNGKLDLVQAEAIADLIDAQTQTAARQAQASLQGDFSTAVAHLSVGLLTLRIYVEAAIDFPDEEIDFLAEGKVTKQLAQLCDEAETLYGSAKRGAIIRSGATVVIAGKPNAGKSSLMNRMARNPIAIVTDVPGTTRDIIKEHVEIGGVALQLTDTAGIRSTDDPIEAEGVRRAHQAITHADITLHIIDDSDEQHVSSVQTSGLIINIYNKIDISGRTPGLIIDAAVPSVAISTKTDAGYAAFESLLLATLGVQSSNETHFSARERHLVALNNARTTLTMALAQFEASGAGELLAEDLRLANEQLGDITGKVTTDQLLGEIFSSFCIGK